MLTETLLRDIPELKVHGRTAGGLDPLTIFWSAGGFECNVTGSELWVELEVTYDSYEPWFSYTINGDWIGRQMLTEGRYWLPLFRGMAPEKVKNVHFYRDLQAMSCDENSYIRVHALRHDGSFLPVEDKRLKLEFIGDSITSGEGLFGAKQEEDWIPMFFSALKSYTYQTAAKLDAEYRVFSQSGWGVHCAWDNDPRGAIPRYYREICSLIPGEKNEQLGGNRPNDFADWQPDCVIINLGTNDTGADTGAFQGDVKSFLKTVRDCNPKARIVWCYGMLGTALEKDLCEALDEYRLETKDEKLFYLRLPEVTEETLGSRGHPGYLCHAQAAEALAKYISDITGQCSLRQPDRSDR